MLISASDATFGVLFQHKIVKTGIFNKKLPVEWIKNEHFSKNESSTLQKLLKIQFVKKILRKAFEPLQLENDWTKCIPGWHT
jgi:hypothetical protein